MRLKCPPEVVWISNYFFVFLLSFHGSLAPIYLFLPSSFHPPIRWSLQPVIHPLIHLSLHPSIADSCVTYGSFIFSSYHLSVQINSTSELQCKRWHSWNQQPSRLMTYLCFRKTKPWRFVCAGEISSVSSLSFCVNKCSPVGKREAAVAVILGNRWSEQLRSLITRFAHSFAIGRDFSWLH